MRRRPLILLLLAAGALGVVGVALADPPQTTTAVKTLGESPEAQVGPAIAVDPAGGTNVRAVALDSDWRSGPLEAQTGYATGTIASSSGATTWVDRGFLSSFDGSDISGGSPDVIWGPANKVYAVEVGRDVGAPQNPCDSAAGIYYSFSLDGGINWNTYTLAPNNPNVMNTDPSITYSPSTGLIYAAYTRQDCSGGASVIRVVTTAADGTDGQPIGNVSPNPTPPDARYEHPSIAALPNGKVAIAYYDAAQSHVLVTTCSPSGDSAVAPSCAPTPVTVDSSAPEPPSGLLGGLPVSVRPSIAAGSDGRVVVVWAKQTALQGMDVFSATSRDNAASFGQPVRVPADPGAGDQFDPSIAIAPDGRADIAFFTSAPGGYLAAASASNHPSGSLNAETWSQGVPVESTPIAPVPATVPGSPTLGSRLGVDEVPRGAIGRAWTLIAWADTRNLGQGPQNEDVYSTVLLHQSTTPVGADAPAMNVPKNVTSPVNFTATDADADPLTYSIAQQGAIGTASIPDPNVPTFMYQAPKVEGPDQVQIRLDDGVHQSTMTVKLNIVNTPPTITCTSLTTEQDTPVSITAANCASDLNGDPVTLTASNPSHGKLQPSGSGVNFVPDAGFIGTGGVTLSATDGSAPPVTLTVPVHVIAPAAIDVKIVGDASRSARTDQPILLHAVPASQTNQPVKWTFDDKTPGEQGQSVSHLFQTAHTFVVSVQVGDNGPPKHIKVIVQKPPLSLKQTTVDGDGTVGISVQLANAGTLTVGMVGVPGAHPMKQKMKRGPHTIQMKLPQSVLDRGVVLVNLTLSLGNGGTEHIKRAVLLPRD